MKDPCLEQQLLLATIDDEGRVVSGHSGGGGGGGGGGSSKRNASSPSPSSSSAVTFRVSGGLRPPGRNCPMLIECETIPEECSSSPENGDGCCPRPRASALASVGPQLRKQRGKIVAAPVSSYSHRQVKKKKPNNSFCLLDVSARNWADNKATKNALDDEPISFELLLKATRRNDSVFIYHSYQGLASFYLNQSK